ncbi:TMhelix containing protein [Vibrio phage 1.187.O._10N.286.49.F1]|nr:TMhelix containing protein [Vibrio phage 1.187.O._10N.286.49.F1]
MLERVLRVLTVPVHILGFTLALLVLAIIGMFYCPLAYIFTADPLKGFYWVVDWMDYHGEHLT